MRLLLVNLPCRQLLQPHRRSRFSPAIKTKLFHFHFHLPVSVIQKSMTWEIANNQLAQLRLPTIINHTSAISVLYFARSIGPMSNNKHFSTDFFLRASFWDLLASRSWDSNQITLDMNEQNRYLMAPVTP